MLNKTMVCRSASIKWCGPKKRSQHEEINVIGWNWLFWLWPKVWLVDRDKVNKDRACIKIALYW